MATLFYDSNITAGYEILTCAEGGVEGGELWWIATRETQFFS